MDMAGGHALTMPETQPEPLVTHPGWLRATHWLNAVAVLVMITSGWRIYNASPLFPFLEFPSALTLGGWLGGALLWHFAAMWLLFANGVFYLTMGAITGRFRRQLFPLRPLQVWRDFNSAIRGRLAHDLTHYNAVQKLAYLIAILDLVMIVLSGLVVFKPVQFPLLRTLMGGYEGARFVHFTGMAILVAFVLIHVVMAAAVPRTILAMIRGR
jgi:thiosulfate reductase cytochrome b subunit